MSYDYLHGCLIVQPIALALERAIECRLLSSIDFPRPWLDVGCGDGTLISILTEGRARPDIGLDLLTAEVRAARGRGVYRSLVGGDATRLPLAANSIGSILCNSVLEHIPDVEGALAEFCRVLKPGGRLVITIPTDTYARSLFWTRLLRTLRLTGLAGLYQRLFNRVFRHYHEFAPAVWKEKARQAGLTVSAERPYLSPPVTTFDDLMYPLASVGWLTHKFKGRYMVWPALRRITAPLLAACLRPLYLSEAEVGGYILLELTK